MFTLLKILGVLLFVGLVIFVGALAMRRNVLANNTSECGDSKEHCGLEECDSNCHKLNGGCCGDEEIIIAKRAALKKEMQKKKQES